MYGVRIQICTPYAAITSAGIALADQDGVDAVSMRKIAGRMGHSPMALYRHVGSKDDLTELMYDAVLGELDLTGIPSGNWRADIARLAAEIRRLNHTHPWIARLGHRPTSDPTPCGSAKPAWPVWTGSASASTR